MKKKYVWFLPLFIASCIITGKNSDLLDPVNAGLNLRDPGNGTIIDTVTKLVWKRCSQGQSDDAACSLTAATFQYCTSDDNACNGGVDTATLESGPAFDSCNALNSNPSGGYAGYTTWRVPTYDELWTIHVNARETSEAGLNNLFPNLDKAVYYLSATSASYNEYRQVLYKPPVANHTATKTTPSALRCVAQ
ncbi:MAG TPA: DUF1566 domain-containing protein [Turneriella sp.]|nr:DUF1566 domain-containing protein [Turneriella sp.]